MGIPSSLESPPFGLINFHHFDRTELALIYVPQNVYIEYSVYMYAISLLIERPVPLSFLCRLCPRRGGT